MYFKWFKLIHVIPGRKTSWKKDIRIDRGNCQNLLYLDHNLIKNNQIYSIEKPKLINLILFLYCWEIQCLPHKYNTNKNKMF